MKKDAKPKSASGRAPIPPPPPRPWQSATFTFSKGRKPKQDQRLSKQLEAIYFSADGEPVQDMGRLEHRTNNRVLRTMLSGSIALIACAALSWGGLILWNPFHAARATQLVVEIIGPDEVTLGKETVYQVTYTNRSSQPLSNVVLRIGLPSGYDLQNSQPEPTDAAQRAWTIGPIEAGGTGTIVVKGMALGGLGQASAIQVLGTYRIEGVKGEQTLVETHALSYTDTVLRLEEASTSVVVAGDPVEVAFSIQHIGEQALTDVVARIETPRPFVVARDASSTQEMAYQDVPLAALAAGATTTASVRGTFAAGVSGEQVFHLKVGRVMDDGTFLALVEGERRVPVLAGDLSLNVVANGSDTDRTLKPGEAVHLAIGYQNVSPELLKDVTLTVTLESLVNGVSATGTSLIDWTEAISEPAAATGTKTRIQTLTFRKDEIPSFQGLASQEQGVIEVTLPTLAAPSGTEQAVLLVGVEATIGGVGKATVKRTLKTRPLVLAYRSDANLIVQARAFTEEGAPLGFGPLPPVAGETTAYRLFWRVEKTLHPLENMEVRATLPAIAKWTGKAEVSAGSIGYDEETRTIRWTLNTLPAEAPSVEASIELEVTPDVFDVGRFAQIVGETRLEARDPIVNEAVLVSRPPLSTDLSEDDAARGKGVVRASTK